MVEKAGPENIIIGSDTAVIDGNEILGKPKDKEDAEKMLKQLRGRTHQVYTGVAIYRVRDGKMLTELCITDVPMRAYSDDEIKAYVQTGDPMDKAGAYAIQHPDFQPVASMHGCYASVMGLPMCHVVRALRKLDIQLHGRYPHGLSESIEVINVSFEHDPARRITLTLALPVGEGTPSPGGRVGIRLN